MDDLEKTIALMGISESVTIRPPTLDLVRAALVEAAALRRDLAAARPVLDAAVAWEREPDPLDDEANNALMEAAYTYRAALSAPVEAGTTEPAPDELPHPWLTDEATALMRARPCKSCGRPFSPSHDVDAPGTTVRHPFIPAPKQRSNRG